ncbi:MAG: hypothetical protein NZZ41_02785 [Candidatus Dojkabacteria bacterium]|nr:hypothetical protein [Candidatus Dojkabacteria bacterium]
MKLDGPPPDVGSRVIVLLTGLTAIIVLMISLTQQSVFHAGLCRILTVSPTSSFSLPL